MLKKSLYDAGALDCGKNKSFRKNINIGQPSPLSVIAIHKNYLTGIGEMNI